MQLSTSARAQVALLFYTTVNLILFTAAVYAVAIFPPLERNAGLWLALFTAAGLLVTAPAAWCLAACWPAAWRKKIIADPSPLAREPTRPV
jgi:hypothetical protein